MTKYVPDFLTCKLGSSKYMSNSVYKFRYPDANRSAPTCVRKYYRSETDVKNQYFHIGGFAEISQIFQVGRFYV